MNFVKPVNSFDTLVGRSFIKTWGMESVYEIMIIYYYWHRNDGKKCSGIYRSRTTKITL